MIVDASVVSAALAREARHSSWAADILGAGPPVAPHLMPIEVCQVLRRRVTTGVLSAADASDGLRDLLDLRAELHPFEPFAHRVWELRDTVSAYDAWYVALAEALDVPLATMDQRLARAPGPRCVFLVPED